MHSVRNLVYLGKGTGQGHTAGLFGREISVVCVRLDELRNSLLVSRPGW